MMSNKSRLLLLYYLIVTIISFNTSFFIKSEIVNYVVVFYFLCVFGFYLFQYLYSIISVSETMKKELPDIYEKHKGVSGLGSTKMVIPTVSFSKEVRKLASNKLQDKLNVMKLVLILLPISFLSGGLLAVLVVLW